jgi:Zn-dependent peptidase ImmA (M78 family)
MSVGVPQAAERTDLRETLAGKLKTARSLTGMSTRAVAAKLGGRFTISHATVANYESGRTVPPMDVLAALADLYGRPINWFLERGKGLTAVRYRNLKSRSKVSELHRYEAEVQRWIDGYVALEARLGKPLAPSVDPFRPKANTTPEDVSREVRRRVGISEDEPVPSVVDVLERFGVRVLENRTDLKIDGLAAKYGEDSVVVLNPSASNDRTRLNAAHELAHVLLGGPDGADAAKAAEQRAFEFASHLLLPNRQLKNAFQGKSMVRLVQFKERFGIPLAAMVYRAERLTFVTKPEAKHLWAEFARRGWRSNEPAIVRPDRATRFEQLIDEGLLGGRFSLKEVADLCGVRPEAIRERLNDAMGIREDDAPRQEEGARTIPFPQ